MAGAFHGSGAADEVVNVGVSGPGVVRAVLADLPKDADITSVAEADVYKRQGLGGPAAPARLEPEAPTRSHPPNPSSYLPVPGSASSLSLIHIYQAGALGIARSCDEQGFLMRLMLDSSIVIDYLKMRDPFYAAARKLILLGFLSEHELWFSSAQANDVFYTLTGGGKPALAVQLKRDLKKLRQGVRICGVNEVEFDAALDSSWSDLEGSCVHQCALKLKACLLYTSRCV